MWRSWVKIHIDIFNLKTSFFFITGHTDDFSSMLDNLIEKYPNTRLVLVGFSLGGNLITKYLGEKTRNHPSNIIGGVSICQGYNAIE